MPSASNWLSARVLGLGACCVLLAPACERRDPPSEIRLELPRVIASRDFVTVAVHAFNAQGVSTDSVTGVELSVEPRELASFSKPALLKCERSGDGKLTVTIAG